MSDSIFQVLSALQEPGAARQLSFPRVKWRRPWSCLPHPGPVCAALGWAPEADRPGAGQLVDTDGYHGLGRGKRHSLTEFPISADFARVAFETARYRLRL